jgi:hypothetical protein
MGETTPRSGRRDARLAVAAYPVVAVGYWMAFATRWGWMHLVGIVVFMAGIFLTSRGRGDRPRGLRAAGQALAADAGLPRWLVSGVQLVSIAAVFVGAVAMVRFLVTG